MINIKNNSIIFFDGKCNLCNSSVNFILRNDSKKFFLFSPLTSDFTKSFFIEKHFNILNLDTIILYENNQLFTKSDAVLRIAKNLDTPLKFLYYFHYFPKNIRDFMYDIIAKNRYQWFGKRTQCKVPSEEILSRFI